MEERTAEHAILRTAIGLKELDRSGWRRLGVDRPESVASHSYGVALAALLLCPPDLDRGKLLAMAVLHDLAEVEVGDLTPHDGVPREEKVRREREAIHGLLASRPDLVALWEEIEERSSPEARLLHALDKLDMGVTAEVYASKGYDTNEFLASARTAMTHVLGTSGGVE